MAFDKSIICKRSPSPWPWGTCTQLPASHGRHGDWRVLQISWVHTGNTVWPCLAHVQYQTALLPISVQNNNQRVIEIIFHRNERLQEAGFFFLIFLFFFFLFLPFPAFLSFKSYILSFFITISSSKTLLKYNYEIKNATCHRSMQINYNMTIDCSPVVFKNNS